MSVYIWWSKVIPVLN